MSSAMEMSWSQTPSKVWWALETGPSSTSLTLDDLRSPAPPSPARSFGDSLRVDKSTIFYNYVEEPDNEENEDYLKEWLKDYRTRGVIRVFQPGTSYSELIKCDIDTTAETIMAKCLSKELYVHYGSKKVRKVHLDEHPLQLQLRFLQELGHSNPYKMQVEGLSEELPALFKFVAGQEKGTRPEDQVQLACPLKVKELHGRIMPVWNKRFCVLCGSRMFIFAGPHPKGKPTLALDLKGGSIEENKTKKYLFCLKVTTTRSVVLLAFQSRLEQGKWLNRAGKIISKHPLEANLAGYSLERIPKYYFLNYNIVALNLAHNFMIESFECTDDALLGNPRTIGWISDIVIFHHLVSLSLSDNCLEHFPISLCSMVSLQELDVSCNGIKNLPPEIKNMTKLTTLLLHSNQLTSLPNQLNELQELTTLVIAFNRFFELPEVVKTLPVLRIFIASGNYISILPDDVERLKSLQHFDLRFNKIKTKLPQSMLGMRNLMRFNIRGNGISEINMADVPYLEVLNCSDNSLRSLALHEGPITSLTAKNNKIVQFHVPVTCEQLTVVDLSKNELTSLPEDLAELKSLEKLDVSNNKLIKLPSSIFKMVKLLVLRVPNNHLVTLPQAVASNCSLETLDLHCNQLTSLPQDLLRNCTKLQMINISSNRLSSLPEVSKGGQSMTEFYAASNSLKDNCLGSISCYRKLKVLHLAYNCLHNIPKGFFTGLKSLEYLNISGNSFSSLPPILGCPYLRCLLAHSNKLQVLSSQLVFHHLHTLDLSSNQFESIPKLNSFPHLKLLDLSGNSSLVVTEESADNIRSSKVSCCCLEGILDINTVLHKERKFVTGGTTTLGKWSYGSGAITGVSKTVDCTSQVKSASVRGLDEDGLFAVMDGGRSPSVPEKLREVLEEILVEELREEEREREEGYEIDPLQYLNHTFLTAHRKLGELGQQYGSSAVLSHIHMLPNGSYTLNVANTGLGEAILCRSGRAVPLTTPHAPATNINERTRIADTRGFVSQDNRVNGVCVASRLLGVYHLWPQIIPVPSTESVPLRTEDEYIVMATNSLWKFITYEQVVHEVKSISDPIQAAKRLRDLAVAHGSQMDISVVVVKLKMDRLTPIHSSRETQLEPLPAQIESEIEEEEEEEEDPGITNIDEALSDEDEDDDNVPTTPLAPLEEAATASQEDMDRMVLNAIGSPSPMEHEPPLMASTNFDDLPLSDESPETPTPGSFSSDLPNKVEETLSPEEKAAESLRHKQHQQQLQQMQLEYEAQTLPKITSQARKSGGFSVETSFEQTQSVPTLQLKWRLQSPQDLSPDPVNNQLLTLNAALTRLEEDTPFHSTPSPYHMESIERPRKRGGRIVKRLSYVERAYSQLTNETYSSDSLQPVQATPQLDTWAAQ